MIYIQAKNICLFILFLLTSCQSGTRDVIETGHPLGEIYPANDHSIDIRFGPNPISGQATGTLVLGFFPLNPGKYSENVGTYSSEKGGIAALTGAVGSMLPNFSKVKSAAIRNALDNHDKKTGQKWDLLGYPMFTIDENDYFLWSHQKVTVRGFPGQVVSIANVKKNQNEEQ